jgi:hypothetical protein
MKIQNRNENKAAKLLSERNLWSQVTICKISFTDNSGLNCNKTGYFSINWIPQKHQMYIQSFNEDSSRNEEYSLGVKAWFLLTRFRGYVQALPHWLLKIRIW